MWKRLALGAVGLGALVGSALAQPCSKEFGLVQYPVTESGFLTEGETGYRTEVTFEAEDAPAIDAELLEKSDVLVYKLTGTFPPQYPTTEEFEVPTWEKPRDHLFAGFPVRFIDDTVCISHNDN